jgi:hypothetical protein
MHGQPNRFAKARARIVWKNPDEYLREHPIPKERYPTGLPTLDAAWGGGMWPNLLLVIQGAPNAGKSSFGIQLAAKYVHDNPGARAYFMIPDEGARAGCVRLGQFASIERDGLEFGEEPALTSLRESCGRDHRFNVVDADAPEAILESFLEQIEEQYGWDKDINPATPPPLFYADSTQYMRTDKDDEFEGKRQQIAYIMAELVAWTVRVPGICLLISHVNRPAFASKKAEDRIDPMAAQADSSDIARSAHAILHLEGELHEVVSGWLRKNRLHRGARPKLSLRYDIPRAAFIELDPATLEEAKASAAELKANARTAAKAAAHENTIAEVANDIEKRFRKLAAGERLSFRQIQALAGGKFENVKDALRGLEAQGAVDWVGGPHGAILWGWKR